MPRGPSGNLLQIFDQSKICRRVLGDLDVVQREEFEAVRAMAQKAREENDALSERIAALEARLAAAPASRKPTPRNRQHRRHARSPSRRSDPQLNSGPPQDIAVRIDSINNL